MILQLMQIGRVALLKLAVREVRLLGPLVAGLNEIGCDIDAEHVRSQPSLWQRCRPVAAPKIEDLETFRNSQALGERLTALPHARCNASKVALFPKRLVWIIQRSILPWLLKSLLGGTASGDTVVPRLVDMLPSRVTRPFWLTTTGLQHCDAGGCHTCQDA